MRFLFYLLLACTAASSPTYSAHSPSVTIKNRTYSGVHSDAYNQDYFIGIPFAHPPLEDLRFLNLVPLNQAVDVRDAKSCSPFCIGYREAPDPYEQSEDA